MRARRRCRRSIGRRVDWRWRRILRVFLQSLQTDGKDRQEEYDGQGGDGAECEVGIGDITGDDEAELMINSEANAAMLVAEHNKRLSAFDTNFKKRRVAADENAGKVAADRDGVEKAVGTMNGVNDVEMEALKNDKDGDGPNVSGPVVLHDPNLVNDAILGQEG